MIMQSTRIVKNTTKILAWVLAWVFIVTSSYAMWNGGGMWNSNKKGGWNWSWQYQNIDNTSKEALQSWHEHNPWDLLEGVPLQDLSENEKLDLLYSYAEESLAHDMYMYFYEMYWVNTFKNIADSEYQHIQAVKSLLDRYEIEIPTWYWELTDEFDALKAEWEKWLKEALEVWVKIEILDINDIAETIQSTDNDDIKIVFTNIGWASFNHLRWFLNWLTNNWFTTDIDYSEFLSEEEVNTKWWALKVKMAELVQSRWVELPTQASPKAIAEKCDKEQKSSDQNMGQWNWNKNGQSMWNKQGLWKWYGQNVSQEKRAQLQKNKDVYKQEIDKKYWNTIKSISNENLIKINSKIDEKASEVVSDTSLSESAKEKVLTLYMALKEYINSIIN